MQLVERIGHHMAHLHTPKRQLAVVDVDSHESHTFDDLVAFCELPVEVPVEVLQTNLI